MRSIHTLSAWRRLLVALARFLFGGDSVRVLETVDPSPQWIRRLTLVRMVAYRNVLRGWASRQRFARSVRALDRWMPRWVAYRGVIRPVCAAKLAAMARRNVLKFGNRVRARDGLSLTYQFADVLTVCLQHEGTFPSEYYAFEFHDPRYRRLAAEITSPYQVEMLATLVRPPADVCYGAGFVSAEIETLNDKEKFGELCNLAGVPLAPAVAVFSGGTEQWTGAAKLPETDLFLKPLRGGEGRGAARIFYDVNAQTYRIDRPVSLLTDLSYPTLPMPAAALIDWLREAGRAFPILLQPRLRAHHAWVQAEQKK